MFLYEVHTYSYPPSQGGTNSNGPQNSGIGTAHCSSPTNSHPATYQSWEIRYNAFASNVFPRITLNSLLSESAHGEKEEDRSNPQRPNTRVPRLHPNATFLFMQSLSNAIDSSERATDNTV